jgi:AcrR family transcriptional regulator
MPRTSKKAKTPRPTTKKARRPRATQAERTAMSHAGLLKATLELVAERGIRGTSLQAIGERAGYSRGLAGHRFGSKEGLLRELMAENVADFQAALGAKVDAKRDDGTVGTGALKALVSVLRELMETRPEAMRAYYMLLFESVLEMPELRAEFERMDEGYRRLFARIIREQIARGTLRDDIDPATHAHLFLAMMRGVTVQWVLDPAKANPRKLGDALEFWLDAALAPRRRRKR